MASKRKEDIGGPPAWLRWRKEKARKASDPSLANAVVIEMSDDAPAYFQFKAEEIRAELGRRSARVTAVTIMEIYNRPSSFRVRARNGNTFCELMDMEPPFQPLRDINVTDIVTRILQADLSGH